MLKTIPRDVTRPGAVGSACELPGDLRDEVALMCALAIPTIPKRSHSA
jgi:hypothetical protein